MGTSPPLLGEPLPVELMNTVWADRDGIHDALRDTAGTAAWLRAVAPRLAPLTAGDVDALSPDDLRTLTERLRGLRDALRRLAAEATGDPRPAAASPAGLAAAVATLNEAAGAVPHWSALVWPPGGQPARLTRTGGDAPAAALSALAEEAIALFGQGGDRLRLRSCLAPGCVLYFLKDHPRREWCSPTCGSRVRARRHYHRHRRPPT
ncbi:CGNR zinc finger domain-containing protein [Streptomyces sp. RFCAC02]|uniref:CGNR zinc finger domain-containing protein n=1 Tax=Streptomyces sp. RFCAC02 TaxID=2499143 RepID=UPI0010226370|nr:CGNR zinc finger domain-containing protein [Streptomyces sp. RFCAC02]